MKGMKGSRAQLGVNAFQREMDESMARMMQDMHGPGYVGVSIEDGAEEVDTPAIVDIELDAFEDATTTNAGQQL